MSKELLVKPTPTTPSEKFSTAGAAVYTGMSEAYFRCGRYTRKTGLPPFYQAGRKIWYEKLDLDNFLQQARRVES